MCYSASMKTIAIANQKGGTAKTTSAAAIAVQLSRQGNPVHIIDMDPQADLTTAFGVQPDDALFHSLDESKPLPVVQVADNLTLSPSSLRLLRAETEFLSRTSREFVLRTSIECSVLADNTVLLIDCPPSLGVLSVAALAAADGICIVVQPGGFELQTLVHLDHTVRLLRQYTNPELEVIGSIVTNSHRRRSITQQIVDELSRGFEVLGVVRSDARIMYATTAGRIHRLRKSAAMDDYFDVAEKLTQWVAQ